METCLYELIADRARYMDATKSLTDRLLKAEAECDRKAQDGKNMAARMVLLEQDKTVVEQRARMAAEEYRADRSRWQAHKQVSRGSLFFRGVS